MKYLANLGMGLLFVLILITTPIWYPAHVAWIYFFWKSDPHLARMRHYIVQTIMDEARDDATIHMLEKWRSDGETPAQRVQHLERLHMFRSARSLA